MLLPLAPCTRGCVATWGNLNGREGGNHPLRLSLFLCSDLILYVPYHVLRNYTAASFRHPSFAAKRTAQSHPTYWINPCPGVDYDRTKKALLRRY